jgi:DNA-binding cell septation regulator SpoVG
VDNISNTSVDSKENLLSGRVTNLVLATTEGAVRATCSVILNCGLVIHNFTVIQFGVNPAWVSPPRHAKRAPDGVPLLNAQGKPIYEPIVKIRKDLEDRIFAAILTAYTTAIEKSEGGAS